MAKIFNIIGIIVFLGFLIYLGIRHELIINEINKKLGYSVATIVSITSGSDGGPDANFKYCVSGKSYSGFMFVENYNRIQKGQQYLLRFDINDPDKASIVLDSLITGTEDWLKGYKLDTCR